jgi:hypothetical protein
MKAVTSGPAGDVSVIERLALLLVPDLVRPLLQMAAPRPASRVPD